MNINKRIYSDSEIKLIKDIFDKYIEQIYEEDLEDLVIQCKEMFLDNQRLMKENKRLNNIINELEKYGKQRFNEYEVWKEECKNLCYINGITEMLDKLQELKGSDKE